MYRYGPVTKSIPFLTVASYVHSYSTVGRGAHDPRLGLASMAMLCAGLPRCRAAAATPLGACSPLTRIQPHHQKCRRQEQPVILWRDMHGRHEHLGGPACERPFAWLASTTPRQQWLVRGSKVHSDTPQGPSVRVSLPACQGRSRPSYPGAR